MATEMRKPRRNGGAACSALGAIRLVNGAVALLAPGAFGKRIGLDVDASPATGYLARMFGVRTVLLGYDLLRGDAETRRRALRVAPLIHASDTVAAALAGATGRLPRRVAVTITAVSGTNTLLALAARRRVR